MIDTVVVEVPNDAHPHGVRGVGEVPIAPPMAAVANAIHDAVGLRLRSYRCRRRECLRRSPRETKRRRDGRRCPVPRTGPARSRVRPGFPQHPAIIGGHA